MPRDLNDTEFEEIVRRYGEEWTVTWNDWEPYVWKPYRKQKKLKYENIDLFGERKMTETEIKVDNVAKNGQGIVSNEKWYNFPKGSTKTYAGVEKGDTVVLSINEDGRVEEFKVKAKAEKKAFTGGKSFGGGSRPVLPENARQTAVNAVTANMKMEDYENNFDTAMEAMKKLENYILKGTF